MLKVKAGRDNIKNHLTAENTNAPVSVHYKKQHKGMAGQSDGPADSLDQDMKNSGLAIALVHLSTAGTLNILDVNDSFIRHFDCPREDVMGRNLLIFLQNVKPAPGIEIAASAPPGQAGGPVIKLESRHSPQNAPPFELDLKPFYTKGNSALPENGGNFICTLRQRHTAEQDLDDMIARKILSSLSHDLRTPLNGILGFSEIMMTEMLGPLGNKSYRGYAEDIHGAGQELLRAIDGLLNLTSIAGGKPKPLVKTNLAIGECVADALLKSGGNASLKHIDIRQHYGPDLPLIPADRERLTDVFCRLISATAKRTPAHGKISISAIKGPGNSLEITFEDEGLPLTSQKLGQIFDPFPLAASIADDSYSDDGSDLGLGFYMVKQTVTQHDGTVAVSNRPQRGLKYSLQLPIAS